MKVQLVFDQNFQYFPNSSHVFFYHLSEDEYVIEVDHHYTFYDEVLEDVVHFYLEDN